MDYRLAMRVYGEWPADYIERQQDKDQPRMTELAKKASALVGFAWVYEFSYPAAEHQAPVLKIYVGNHPGHRVDEVRNGQRKIRLITTFHRGEEIPAWPFHAEAAPPPSQRSGAFLVGGDGVKAPHPYRSEFPYYDMSHIDLSNVYPNWTLLS